MKEPSFLRKLKSEYGGGDSHRHERPLARPRKKRIGDEDDDDEPTYVDEGSNETISKSQYDTLIGNPPKDEPTGKVKVGPESIESPPGSCAGGAMNENLEFVALKQNIAQIGNRKKRKAAKVIDEEADDTSLQTTSKLKSNETDKGIDKKRPRTRAVRSVKLSFEDQS